MAERVTVVIPTRNRCQLLRQTLATVLAQDGVDVDVVIVDEGSTDETPEMLQRMPQDRVTLLRHEQAEGVSVARNAGIAAATGEWVAFVDDDDIWAPMKLRAQLAAIHDDPGAEWACVGAVRVNEQLELLGRERYEAVAATAADSLLACNVIPGGASGVLARTGLVRQVGSFDPALANLADYDLWIRLSLAAPLAVVDRPLVGYRVHSTGMAHNVARSERELDYIEQKYVAARRDRGITVHRESFLWYFGALALRQGNRLQAMRIHRDLALQRHDRPVYALSLALLGGLWPGIQGVRDGVQAGRLPLSWRTEAENWIAPLRRSDARPAHVMPVG